MIQKIVQTIIDRKAFVRLLIFMILLGGTFSYIHIPKQNYPEFSLPVASVVVVYPGATAEDMENIVTRKVEDTVMTLDGFDYCDSITTDNISSVMISLDLNLSEDRVAKSFDDLRLKMNALKNTLPLGVTQIIVDTDTMDTAGLLIAITGDSSITGDELSQRSDELEDKLKQIDGVRKTKVFGEQLSEVQIIVDTTKLNNIDLSMGDLAALIAAQNSLMPTGDLHIEDQIINVYTSGKFENINEIKKMIIGVSADTGILYQLSDIADVQIKMPDDIPGYTYNKEPCTLLAVYFDKSTNVIQNGEAIHEILDNFSKTLPNQIKVNDVYLQPDVVKYAINDFGKNVAAAILLVLIVILFGIGFRNALVVCVAIPLSISIAFISMPFFGIEIQFVSLAALIVVLGMLVDNSVVVNDAIQIRIDQGEDRISAVKNGTADVSKPVLIATLTAVIGFTSLLTLTGAYKQIAFSMPVVIIVCLIASFVTSMLVTPLISYLLLKESKASKFNGMQKISNLYDRLFQIAYRHKMKTIFISIVFLVICLSSLFFIDPELASKSNKDVVTIQITGNNSRDIQKTRLVMQQVEALLDEQPEVSYYLSGTGIGIPRYDYSVLPKGQHNALGDIFVRIDLTKSDRFKATDDMVAFLQHELDIKITGGSAIVDQLGIMAFMSKPVEIKLYSDNLEHLNVAADRVANIMNSTDGLRNVEDISAVNTYDYYVDMDTNALNALGLTKAEIQNELSIALLGRNVSLYRQNEKEYNIVLKSTIDNLKNLENFKIKSSLTSNKYALQQFSDIALTSHLTQINRISGQRGRAIGGYPLPGFSAISVQTEVETQLENLEFPEGVTWEKSGEKKEFFNFLNAIISAALFSFVLIFLLLFTQFNSIKKSLMVFVSLPFGAVAGIAALYLTDTKLAMFALIGVLSLMGVVLANAIVLIDYIDSERLHDVTVAEACRSAGAKRFRPILISTMTSVLGLLPLVINGDPFFKPMAILMLTGLFVAMFINLIIVPILYDILYSKSELKKAPSQK